MYQNKLVAAIKVNGQILRETHNHSVAVPFGSEYSIFIKNLNTVRVQIQVSVDGTDATSGTWLVIPPNSSFDLERFIRDGNWSSGNRFKFIERTAGIESHRGIKADDGIVRIEYQRERVQQIVDETIVRKHYFDDWIPVPRPYYPPRWPFYRNHIPSSMRAGASRTNVSASGASASSGHRVNVNYSAPVYDAGITVPGSLSQQQFHAVQGFACGPSEVIVMHLRGVIGGKAVKTAVTVKSKFTCQTCGKTSKSGMDFCANCGTALQIA